MKAGGRRSRIAAALGAALLLVCSVGVGANLDAADDVDNPEPEPPASAQPLGADLDGALEQALDSGGHGFCREPRHRLGEREEPLCGFAKAASGRCPTFAAACDRARGLTPKEDPAEGRSFLAGLMQALAVLIKTLGYVLLVAILGLAVVLVVLLAIRVLRAPRSGESSLGAAPSADEAAGTTDAGLGFERDAEVHLARARSLAERGEYEAAVFELHLGVVLSLDGRGLIEARRGRSNGDYARDLASHPELRSAFREVSRAAEAVQFGGRSATRDVFERLLGRASPLLGSLVLCLGLIGALGCDGHDRARGADRCGTRADGYSLLCELLAADFRAEPAEVHRRYRPLEELADDFEEEAEGVDAILLLPMTLTAPQQEALDVWVSNGGLLLLTGAQPGFDVPLGVRRSGPSCEAATTSEGDPLFAVGSAFESTELSSWATCTSGHTYIGHAPWEEGRIIFLPNAEVLSNASLVAAENARALWPLLSALEGRVELVGNWTGNSAANPLAAVSAAGLLPWIGQLLLLGFVYALHRGAPFGRRRELRVIPRRRFSEHVQALGERWAEARAARTALAAYASFALDVLAERMPSRGERRIGELASVLARKTGRSEAQVARTLAHARLAREDAPALEEGEDLKTLRELGRLLEESGGPR